MNMSMFKSLPANKDKKPENYVIPSTILPTLFVLVRAICVMGFVILGDLYFSPAQLISPEFSVIPFYQKLLLMHAVVASARFKFYFAWFIAEGSCVACGLGYNGVDEKGKLQFNRCTNVVIHKVELAENIRDFSSYWNISTARWMRRYVYTRVESKNHFVPLLATYFTSAFWHGFYPGYYLFFITSGFLTEISREARRRLRPRFLKADGTPILPWKYAYDVAGIIACELVMSYSGCAFVLLSFEDSLKSWTILRFSGHIALVLAAILILLVPMPTTGQATSSTSERNGKGPKKTK